MKSRRVSIRFTDQAHDGLATRAHTLGISVSDLVRRVVDEWRRAEELREWQRPRSPVVSQFENLKNDTA